jgi:RNA polymerase sigma-70 factor (TIGR02957 family)
VTDVTAAGESLRPLMFSVAYRMLGSVTEAEDVVQEAYLRLHRSPPRTVDSPEAYATTVTTRIALDHLRSARVRRERYVGAWLPEPLLTSGEDADPALRAEVADSLSTAFLVLLETLSPVERAVFVLREVFGYPYDRVAAVVGKSEPSCRQVFVRAKARIDERRPRFEASRERRDALAARFLAACETGEVAALEEVLAEDVTFQGDGGGRAPAVAHPVTGRRQVARFLRGIMRQGARLGLRYDRVEVNGQPGVCAVDPDGRVVAVLALDVVDGHVQALHNVLNPEKLTHLARRLR